LEQSLYRRWPVATTILAAGVALQAAFILLHGANKELFGDGAFLALDKDASVPSWATVVLYALAGIACASLAWLSPRLRWPLLALGGIALLLSLEQTAQVHVNLENDAGDPAASLVALVIGGGFAAALAAGARALGRPHSLLLWLAIAAIVVSGASSAANDGLDPPYAGVIFFQTVEEVSEMLAATLILAAVAEPLLAAARRRLQVSEGGSPPGRV
jgi:hypothetical protein